MMIMMMVVVVLLVMMMMMIIHSHILFNTATAFPFVQERQRNLFQEILGFITFAFQYKPSRLTNSLEPDTVEHVRSQIGHLLYLLYSWMVQLTMHYFGQHTLFYHLFFTLSIFYLKSLTFLSVTLFLRSGIKGLSPRTLMISIKFEPPSDKQLHSAYNSGGRPEESDE